MQKIFVGLLLVAALPLAADLRRGIIDETIPGDLQIQSKGENMVMMIIDSRADAVPDGVADFVLTLRAETPFGESFAFRINGASVHIRTNRVLVFGPDRGLAAVFEHDANCADCDFGRPGVLRFTGYEMQRLDRDARWPRLPARVPSIVEEDHGAKPRPVVKTQRKARIGTNDSSYTPYEPVDYWDPCAGSTEDGYYESSLCAGGGGGTKPAQSCQAGGVGSTSCSVTGCMTSYGSASSCSTSCSAGYYACCYCTKDADSAHCGCYKQ